MNLKGKKALVVGLGKTGEAVCQFLLDQQAEVKVTERRNAEQIAEKIQVWTDKGVNFETGGHQRQSFLESDLIIPSPGVALIPELKQARENGIEIISEIELAFRFLRGKIIGITGTNGKSTTATLTHQILVHGGIKAYLAGNIGTPLISYVETSESENIYVTELSSFQLEYTRQFKAFVSVFLNVTPDHLDWHLSFDNYFASKKRLADHQTEQEHTILNRDDPLVWSLEKDLHSSVFGFSRKTAVTPGCFIEQGWIVCSDDAQEKIIQTEDIPLPGIHNQENVIASVCIGHLLGLPASIMEACIKDFKGLEHRLEKIATLKDIDFYNDSKATNVGATLKSIESFDQQIILILGGRDKGGRFGTLKEPAAARVKKILLLGEAKEKIARALHNDIPMEFVFSLKEAVEKGFESASPGDIVLLAPACTSFDMFVNFEERGKAFKQEVMILKERISTGSLS